MERHAPAARASGPSGTVRAGPRLWPAATQAPTNAEALSESGLRAVLEEVPVVRGRKFDCPLSTAPSGDFALCPPRRRRPRHL
eukprot:scaffold77021_cov60-Phaeocystis_antarctica.AAC.1